MSATRPRVSKRVLIVGASSGIGEGLARLYANRGDHVAATARRMPLLKALLKKMGAKNLVAHMDVTKPEAAIRTFRGLAKRTGGFDIIILNAGWGSSSRFDWAVDRKTIDTNVRGFTALAQEAWYHFKKSGGGQLVSISSIAALRGNRHAPAYNASKAYMSTYMEGLRGKARAEKIDITLTDIQPGFVDTAMAKADRAFWIAPVDKACRQIIDVIDQKREHAYITRRWRLVAWIIKLCPGWIYRKL